jgi:hypothetical protein
MLPSSTFGCRQRTRTRAWSPRSRLVLSIRRSAFFSLSQYIEPSYAMRLIEDHPERVGYLLKERVYDIATVVDALRRIVDGETVIDPTSSRASLDAVDATTRSTDSATRNKRYSSSSPKACRTEPSPPG